MYFLTNNIYVVWCDLQNPHGKPDPHRPPTTITTHRAEEPAMTMALAFALLLELGDRSSRWRAYWDSFPPASQVPNIFDFDGDLVRMSF